MDFIKLIIANQQFEEKLSCNRGQAQVIAPINET